MSSDQATSPEAAADQRVRMNTSTLKSSYCNAVNATTRREEVHMLVKLVSEYKTRYGEFC